MIKVLTSTGNLNPRVRSIIRTFSDMGVDVQAVLTKELTRLEQQEFREVNLDSKTTDNSEHSVSDRIIALKQILKTFN